jgi:hypothetical protein
MKEGGTALGLFKMFSRPGTMIENA